MGLLTRRLQFSHRVPSLQPWHVPEAHTPEQQSAPVAHAAPVIRHTGVWLPQTGGLPTQLPPVHSKPDWQVEPLAKGGDMHKCRPVPSSVHVP